MANNDDIIYRAAAEAIKGILIKHGTVNEQLARDWLDVVLKDAPQLIPPAMSHVQRTLDGPKPFDTPPIA